MSDLWVSKTGLVREDWRVKHGTKSRVKAGCTCDLCSKFARSATIAKNRVAEEMLPVPGMTDIGWIILQVQAMAEDKRVPAYKRERARYWYQKLTMADCAPATSIVTESGGRRRSHNARRLVAVDMEYHGPAIRPLIET